jgi:hypothetical protein
MEDARTAMLDDQMYKAVRTFGSKTFALCRMTRDYFLAVAPRINKATEFSDDAAESVKIRLSTLRGYNSRALAWLNTVAKLDDIGDIQAVVVASRALFEMAVDLILIHEAPQKHPLEKLFCWERSAVLKQKEALVCFYSNKPADAAATDGYDLEIARQFLTGSEAERIRADRLRLWPPEKQRKNSGKKRMNSEAQHPQRWTGHDLAHDVKIADDLFSEANFLQFYKLEIPAINCLTHGSGLSGLRSTNPNLVPATCAMRLNHVAEYAQLILRTVLVELKIYDQVEFRQFEEKARTTIGKL